jgi:hypothetical protein
MRFTEHEMTVALTAAAQTVVAAGRKDVRAKKTTPEEVWTALTPHERFRVLDGLGDQILPVLAALPDREVEAGSRPTFTRAQVVTAVEQQAGDEGGWLRRKAAVAARVALVRTALAHLPPRQDPDALVMPDIL